MSASYRFSQRSTSSISLGIPLSIILAAIAVGAEPPLIQVSPQLLPFQSGTGGQLYNLVETSKEKEQIRILQNFAVALLSDMKEIDADMAQVVNEKFWDIYERF